MLSSEQNHAGIIAGRRTGGRPLHAQDARKKSLAAGQRVAQRIEEEVLLRMEDRSQEDHRQPGVRIVDDHPLDSLQTWMQGRRRALNRG